MKDVVDTHIEDARRAFLVSTLSGLVRVTPGPNAAAALLVTMAYTVLLTELGLALSLLPLALVVFSVAHFVGKALQERKKR